MRSLEKARLYLAMEPGKIKIIKGKNWASQMNPNGLEREFKLIQGCYFQAEETWRKGYHGTHKNYLSNMSADNLPDD